MSPGVSGRPVEASTGASSQFLRIFAVANAYPALLAFVGIVAEILDCEGLPQLHFAGTIGVVGEVRWRRLGQRHRLMADRAYHGVDDVEDGLRGAEACRDRKIAKFA